MSNNTIPTNNDDCSEIIKRKIDPNIANSGFRYTININESFADESEWYKQLLQLRNIIKEKDELEVWINSGGGDAHICEQVRVIISSMPCKVKEVYVTGIAASAAVNLFVSVDWTKCYISRYTEILIHNAFIFTFGKMPDIKGMIDNFTLLLKTMYKEIYKHILTKEEIENVLNGKEHYLTGEEFYDRLLNTKRFGDKVTLL